jgi:hypothetical protein
LADSNDGSGPETGVDEAEAARRDVLDRLGVMGRYVAPAMMVLLSSKASAQTITSGTTG